MRRVSKSMQLEFVGARKRLSAVRASVSLRVERPRMSSRRAVHVKRLVTPRARIHFSDRVGMKDGMSSEYVDLVKSLVTQTAQVVLAARVHLAVTSQRRVVDETTITYLQRFTSQTYSDSCHISTVFHITDPQLFT